MLAAGLAGIEEDLALVEPLEETGAFDRKQQEAGKRSTLPSSLGEAIDLFESSNLMKQTLGEHIHSYLVDAKRAEWIEYLQQVSQWELDKYLAVL